MTGSRPPIDAEQGRVWIAEGESAARTGAPIDANPYDGHDEQVQRLLWLRGYLRHADAPGGATVRRWA